jgi:hypothetical protein
LFVGAERHAALIVGNSANAGKIVIAAKPRESGLMDQTQQASLLRSGRVAVVEPHGAAAGVTMETGIGQPPD